MKNIMFKLIQTIIKIDWCIFAPAIGALICLLGCSSNPKMVEGTTINLGAYLPWDGNIYGVELISYVNGIKVNSSSNQAFQVEREYASTNSWAWGLLESRERSKTKVEVK